MAIQLGGGFSAKQLIVWGVVALIICVVVIAAAPHIPVAGAALAAVAGAVKPFAIAAVVIGAIWWLLNVLGVL